MSDSDLRLKLLAGLPIHIENICTINPLTVRSILEIGEQRYNRILSILLFDKNSIEELKQTDVSNLEVIFEICRTNIEFLEEFINGIYLFTHEKISIHSTGFLYFEEDNIGSNRRITPEVYDNIQYILKVANNIIEKEEEYNPANERARKLIDKLKISKKEVLSKKKNIDLHSIISGIAWKSNSCNIFDVFNLTLYQLYDGFYRQNSIDNYHYTLQGMYSGTVDGKKINLSNINWANIIKI